MGCGGKGGRWEEVLISECGSGSLIGISSISSSVFSAALSS